MRPLIRHGSDAWTVDWGGSDSLDDRLPPDLNVNAFSGCCMNNWQVWLCTRPVGHTGRHAAGNGRYILAVWPGHLGKPPKPWR